MRLKIKISDSNRGVEVRNSKTGEILDGVVGIKFDTTMGALARVSIEIAMPWADLEFVPDDLVRKDCGVSNDTEKSKERG